MSRNTGRNLEELVAQIERHFLPRGFDVTTRTPVFNDQGVQTAEFDILITGRIGTGRISWLIECRDRPSDGPAPGQWIEQLVGRRTRFGFDKVMAVSSTGFSPGAIEAAEDAGIELRSMESLSFEDVAHWLPPSAPMIIREGRFSAVRIFLGESHAAADSEGQPIPIDDKVLLGSTSGERLSLRELWTKVVNQESLWRGMAEGEPPREITVNALEHSPEAYGLVLEGESLPLSAIEYDAIIQIKIPWIPLVEASEYSSIGSDPASRETFARLGTWRGVETDIVRGLTIIGFRKQREPSDET